MSFCLPTIQSPFWLNHRFSLTALSYSAFYSALSYLPWLKSLMTFYLNATFFNNTNTAPLPPSLAGADTNANT